MPKQTRRMRRKRVRGGRLFGFGAKSQKQIDEGLKTFYDNRDKPETNTQMIMHPILPHSNDDATNDDATSDADLPPPPDEKYIVNDGTRRDFIMWLNEINKEFNWSTLPDKALQEIADEIDKQHNKLQYLSDFAIMFTKKHIAINKEVFNKKGGKTRRKRRRRYTKK